VFEGQRGVEGEDRVIGVVRKGRLVDGGGAVSAVASTTIAPAS